MMSNEWGVCVCVRKGTRRDAYQNETEHGDDGHEDARTFAESKRVELYERLRGVERKERVEVRDAEQEKDGRDEAEHAGGDRARDNTSSGYDAVYLGRENDQQGQSMEMINPLCVLRLFGDVA